MATIPSQGGSDGTWGTEIIAHLAVEHDSEGYHPYGVCYEDEAVCYLDEKVSNPQTY